MMYINSSNDCVNIYTLCFHRCGDLLPVAYSSDGIVMAIEHIKKSVYGVMWHIERETPFRNEEKNLFKEIFCKGLS